MNGEDKVRKQTKRIFLLLILAACVLTTGCAEQKNNPESGILTSETKATAAEPSESKVVTETPTVPTEKAEETDRPEETAEEKVQETEQPFLVQITEDDPSIAYVLVRMPNPVGLLPLPLEGEYTRTIRQTNDDGTEMTNILHLTPNGFWMEDANCEGHDCVNMGEVTLENREERVLWNMIICLPHQLSLELITREEAEAMIQQYK